MFQQDLLVHTGQFCGACECTYGRSKRTCAPKLVWGWLLECLDVVVGVHVNNFGLKKAGVPCYKHTYWLLSTSNSGFHPANNSSWYITSLFKCGEPVKQMHHVVIHADWFVSILYRREVPKTNKCVAKHKVSKDELGWCHVCYHGVVCLWLHMVQMENIRGHGLLIVV